MTGRRTDWPGAAGLVLAVVVVSGFWWALFAWAEPWIAAAVLWVAS